jgi:hypothetical protein
VRVEFVSTCVICGGLIRSEAPADWHPGKRARRAERDMLAHLSTHPFAEVLRYEIRQDLDQVPEEQRPTIVRDIYRSLLGTTLEGRFVLNDADGRGVYSIEETLGDISTYRLWRSANNCAFAKCPHSTMGAHDV